MTADTTYQPKVYRRSGGDTQTIASGGLLEIEEGGTFKPAVQELTASGAISAGVQSVELNHVSVKIEATIADTTNHPGFFIVKATSEPAGGSPSQSHTVTLTSGTWDGTNTIATFADILDTLAVYFDSDGNGTIIENVGSVALS